MHKFWPQGFVVLLDEVKLLRTQSWTGNFITIIIKKNYMFLKKFGNVRQWIRNNFVWNNYELPFIVQFFRSRLILMRRIWTIVKARCIFTMNFRRWQFFKQQLIKVDATEFGNSVEQRSFCMHFSYNKFIIFWSFFWISIPLLI